MSDLRVEGGLSSYYLRRERAARARTLKRVAAAAALFVVGCGVAVALAFAGSGERLPDGVTIGGVDVGGMTPAAAEEALRTRYADLVGTPLVVAAGGKRFELGGGGLGLVPDWRAAVAEAQERGDGFAPIRGFRRLYLRVAGVDVVPAAHVYHPALDAELARIARAVDVPHRDAALLRRGLEISVVPAQAGRLLDRREAERLILESFATFSRRPLELPSRSDPPRVSTAAMARVAAQARIALSKPVRLTLGRTRYRIPRWRIAQLLELPKDGARALTIAGPQADAFFRRLEKTVNSPPRHARFRVLAGGKVRTVPSVNGRAVDVQATAQKLLAAAVSRTRRVAPIVVDETAPSRTTAKAKAMGIRRLVAGYTTAYGGVANRLHNVRLVARLIDNTLIAPGKVFSFNARTGERTPAKGFLTAPVIINGELQTALGGGVCQVSTTVFNAAYEAGLRITERTNHYLYISHYPQGRDATVNYPDLDLKFVNDTGRWLLLRTFVTPSSLTVNLYGTPLKRKVETEVSPLVVTGPAPVKRIADATLEKGKELVEDGGSPSLSTRVRRRVYDAKGKLLYENVWRSSYLGEKRVIRVGTKPKRKPKPEAKGGLPATPATPGAPLEAPARIPS